MRSQGHVSSPAPCDYCGLLVDAEAARVRFRERIEHRTDNFLELARTSIFPLAESPYRRLLDHAGGELGDVERLVEGDGLEGALQELYRRGVYLTVDEFKGRAAVTRGSMSFTVDSKHLHNPRVSGDMVAQTSGSRGRRTSVPMELGAVQDNAYFDLDGSIGCVHARWSVPGSGSLRWMVGVAVRGTAPERWFTRSTPRWRDYTHATL